MRHNAAYTAYGITGDPAPSPADLIVTRNLRAAGETLGINLFEHIILGTRVDDPLGVGYYSFSRTGVL
jgi:DNA repair protein RadC